MIDKELDKNDHLDLKDAGISILEGEDMELDDPRPSLSQTKRKKKLKVLKKTQQE